MTRGRIVEWTPAQNARLRELVEAGNLSNASIAGVINSEFSTSYSRNAVIGRASRMGISTCRLVGHQAGRPKVVKPRKPKATSRTVMRIIGDRPSLVPEYTQPATPVADVEPLRVTFADLQPGQCKFECSGMSHPVDFRFCGLPADGPWCAKHHAICWQPRRAYVQRPHFRGRRAA